MVSHWGPERSPAGKWISWIFDVRKKPSETPLSVILSGGGPPNVAGPRKLPPFPVSMGLSSAVSETSHVSYGDSHLFYITLLFRQKFWGAVGGPYGVDP